MSCNGCRVLRKGCGESCILRPCLQWIESAEAQGHATVFVAKFFGRAGLMNFISSVPAHQRPGLFQSLLFEACGRTVNPVNGAVGLLWTGNWHVCQAAVETVLRGGALQPLPNLQLGAAEVNYCRESRRVSDGDDAIARSSKLEASDLDLRLSPTFTRRPGTPSEGSVTTTSGSGGDVTAASAGGVAPPQLLNLLV